MKFADDACNRMIAYRPPRIAMTLLILAALFQFVTLASLPQPVSFPITGISIGVLGFTLMIRAWWLFQRYQTAICPTDETTTFISNDVYALTRNPMYLGMILMLLGVALVAGGWSFYLVAATYALILNHVFCRYEERHLQAQYGDRYVSYAGKVRRWL